MHTYIYVHTHRPFGPHICRYLVNTAPSNCWDGDREREEDIEEYTNDDIVGQGVCVCVCGGGGGGGGGGLT